MKRIEVNREMMLEFLRFAIVGTTSTLIHYLAYWLFQYWIDLNIAFTLGYIVSFCWNYYLSARFTFHKKATASNGVGFGGAHLVNYLLEISLFNLFLSLGFHQLLAPLAVYCISVPANFVMVRFVFHHNVVRGIGHMLKRCDEWSRRHTSLYLLRIYLWTLLVFIVAKAGFMLSCHGEHSLSLGDMMQVIVHGLSLDLSTALYVLILPYLGRLLSLWRSLPPFLSKCYFGVIALAFALAFVADASLYPFWGYKLDASCLQYLATPSEAMASVSVGYLLWRLLLVLLFAFIVYKGYPAGANPRLRSWRSALGWLMLIPVFVVGIRGGIDESTTNVGQVYFSRHQFLNHSAVNPVFSFLSSFEKSANQIVTYDFMDAQEAAQITDSLYQTDDAIADTLLRTRRPDIVVILMESCGGQFTDISGRTDITPRLNQLKQEGIYFANCYANSWRTDRGTVCTWSGYPAFPTMSVMKMPRKTATLPSIARSLAQEGYQTTYLYGGDINFTNMRSYLVGTQFERLIWKADYTNEEQHTAQWGVRDDITFATLFNLLTDGKRRQAPQLIGFSTLSSHEPWDVPIQQLDDPVENAFYYLDQCIGTFVDSIRTTPSWENLLLILLPDHGIIHRDVDEQNPLKNHIPMLWLGGAVGTAHRIEAVCNQTDLPATLLPQLGLSAQDFTFSRNVVSPSYRHPFAIHTYNNGFSMVDSTTFVCYDLTVDRSLTEQGPHSHQLVRQGKAILQVTSNDLDRR